MSDLVFHLLDIQARDMRIESEQEDVVEVTYDSHSDEDDEIQTRRQTKKTASSASQRQFIIHLFGATETGQPLRCDVTGFRPTMYLRLPEEKTSAAASSIQKYIRDQLTKQRASFTDLTITRITKKIFYGFTAQTFYPFLQIDVPSISLFRTLRSMFLDEFLNSVMYLDDNTNIIAKRPDAPPPRGKKIEIFEANLDPMLRFLHVQNIQPCGWVRVKDGKQSITSDQGHALVLECDYEQIVPTQGPRVSAPFLTASWDIECFSRTGDFPVAKRTWRKTAKELLILAKSSDDVIAFVTNSICTSDLNPPDTLTKGMTTIYATFKKGMTLERVHMELTKAAESFDTILKMADGQEEMEQLLGKTLNRIVTLTGDPVIQIGTTLTRGTVDTTEHHLFVFPDCADIPGIEVHAYPTEELMIVAWFDWMIERDADILIGYNVFGFDESYLWERAEELKLVKENAAFHAMNRLMELSGELKLEEKFLSSSAMGDNRMYIWTTQGRLQIDLFHYIKRNNVLPSYKLDEVTKHFMSGKLKKQSYDATTRQLRLEVAGAIKDVRTGRAITLLDETGETVSQKLMIDNVEGNVLLITCDLDADALVEMEDATKWVVVKDDVSPQDIFRLHRGSAEDRAIVGKYCIQDCVLVIDLYKKLETFNNSMSMANVCSVPVSYIFTRGQGIKIESLMFKCCRERNVLIPVLPAPTQGGDDSYEGAIVLDPQPGFYSTSPIGVCDFASLYPSTIVSENISHDSLLWVKDFTNEGELIAHQWGSELYDECDGYGFTDIEYDIIRSDPSDSRKHPRKIKCGRRICRFAQPLDGTKSTLPQITTWLLTARSAKKKEMKAEKDPERYALLDAEQLAYKLTGNSLYGQLGSGTFKIRLQALAASVTAYGRKQILYAKAAIEHFYGPEAKNPKCAARCMAKVVYGDSVTGDTPLTLRHSGKEVRVRMDELYSLEPNGIWMQERDKDFYELHHCESWTEVGWTRIHRIIRHRLPALKKLYRVYIQDGYIDVTDDHSLLTPDGSVIPPTKLVIGSRLLSTKYINGDIVQNIVQIDSSELPYVYDLTTENHHFQAGPEGLIVHNTDSLFVEFNPRNPETGERLTGREARVATIEMTDEAGALITKTLAAPHDFEFDKAFDPLLMFSKKRYAGNMYEENPDDYVHKYMGIALKRRDNAPIVKTIFGGAMKMLLDKRDVIGAFQFVKEKCLELVDGKVNLGQLTVTKSLRADYADPARIAHKALADRITMRDPGNAPAAGDRIGYVYISAKAGQEASKLQGERIETPQFIKDHQLVPDYRHYIEHQLQNPISQAFGLLLEQIPGFQADMIRSCPAVTEDLDKYLAFREAKAAELLFSDCLRRFEKSSTRHAIAGMFKGSVVISKAAISKAAISNTETTSATSKPITRSAAKQTTMSSFLLDSMIVDGIKKKNQAKAAAATRAANKKAKEESI
jgi:DNA polymerase elongation subunit (family B)